MAIETEAVRALGRAAGAVGQERFYHALLDAFGMCLAHDLSAVMRYSPFSQPDLLFGSDYGPEFQQAYARDFYRFDPFYQYWKDIGCPGVVSLLVVVKTEADRDRYVSTILADIGVTDEIGIFLPPVGRSSLAMFLDRCGGTFSPDELETAQSLYDLLAGLHAAHVNAVFGSARLETGGAGALLAGSKPTRVLDRACHEILRNEAWTAYERQHAGPLTDAMQALATEGQTRIGPDLILHRATLPTDFHLAPCGLVDTIEPLGLSPMVPSQLAMPDRMRGLLTRREQDIVGLMLRGYPTKKIAGQLGLTQGTIKNYRRRIYDKLDITTEREVFLSCMAETGSMSL